MLKEKELPDTIEYTGNNKPLVICHTFLELIKKAKDGNDIYGGQVMEYLPTDNPKIYKKGTRQNYETTDSNVK